MSLYRLTTNPYHKSSLVMKAALQSLLFVILEYVSLFAVFNCVLISPVLLTFNTASQ